MPTALGLCNNEITKDMYVDCSCHGTPEWPISRYEPSMLRLPASKTEVSVVWRPAGSSLALRMRMQWWRDALGELYPNEPATQHQEPSVEGFLNSTAVSCWNNPVVRALHHAIQEKDLTKRFLERLLDAREADLDIRQLATMEDATFYAEDTCSNLLYLSLECAGVRDEAADEVASNAGIGWGLTTSIRATLHRANNGEMAIPAEILPSTIPTNYLLARLNPEFTPNEANETAIREAIQYMAFQASTYLNRAREIQGKVPRKGRSCLLPAVPALHHLSRLQEAQFNIFDEKLNANQSRLVLLVTLGKSWFVGKF
eukprot:CAMPEP_0116575084 /NCGR_PEP_ID=MMETSP0397-20121206/19756_1 /TAXON_ID=216820 /ORGANISM="Cyclophora tenuis, Strain ECT3854" /LENGTH=313 /DNA_ID=CAMNT_0004103927 /DNA_START=19 /DNA_END=960 /DNA_ORIENTATION=+